MELLLFEQQSLNGFFNVWVQTRMLCPRSLCDWFIVLLLLWSYISIKRHTLDDWALNTYLGLSVLSPPEGEPGNPCARWSAAARGGGSPSTGPRGAGPQTVRSSSSSLLFNILKCDDRINEARLPDPYVVFSVAWA